MGVKCLIPYREQADVQAATELKERIVKRLHGRKLGRWNLTCTLYLHSAAGSLLAPDGSVMAQEQLYLLKEDSLSQKDGDKTAGKCCLMAQNTIIEAGLEMEQILEKIKLYNPRQTVTIRGMQYEVGDFVVKVGSIMLGDTTRGVILEVEYRPCMIPNGCSQILQSFIGNLGPFNAPFSANVNYGGVTLPRLYSAQHTALQYVRLFQGLKYFKAHH